MKAAAEQHWKHRPDVCDDDQMFTDPLMAVHRETHLQLQILEQRVLHLGLCEWWEVMGFGPIYSSSAPQ